MTDSTKLIERLRVVETYSSTPEIIGEAAALIEQQAARIAESESHRNDLADKIVEQKTEIGALKSRIAALELQVSGERGQKEIWEARATEWCDRATALESAAKAEPVGETGAMPGTDGFTMACFKASDVPIGTKLYTAPTAALEKGDGRDAQTLREALQALSHMYSYAWDRTDGALVMFDIEQFEAAHEKARAALSQKAGEQQ